MWFADLITLPLAGGQGTALPAIAKFGGKCGTLARVWPPLCQPAVHFRDPIGIHIGKSDAELPVAAGIIIGCEH